MIWIFLCLQQMSKHPEEIEEGEIIEDQDQDQEEYSDSDAEISSLIDPGEEGEEMDLAELLGTLFATDEGDTVCSALIGISTQMQVQNKILVKMLAQLQSSKK
jgi:hypothetical protein|tara:strand:- start:3395 stop:3703 length:309 start_codon:yes stop_codon:yes gene_type:complete